MYAFSHDPIKNEEIACFTTRLSLLVQVYEQMGHSYGGLCEALKVLSEDKSLPRSMSKTINDFFFYVKEGKGIEDAFYSATQDNGFPVYYATVVNASFNSHSGIVAKTLRSLLDTYTFEKSLTSLK